MILTKEQQENDLVKSLSGNFSEEVIAGWINSGAINLEKSIPGDEPDADETKKSCNKGEDDKDCKESKVNKSAKTSGKKENHDEDDEDDVADVADESKTKEKSCHTPKKATSISLKGGSDTDMVLKSILSEFGSLKQSNEDVIKSLPNLASEAIAPTLDKFEKSIEAMRVAVEAFGNSAPAYKGAGLSKSVIMKSVGEPETSFTKDEGGKISLSISKDRTLVRELIQKSIEEESDSSIKKSILDNTSNYILDPIEGAIGEPAAMYLYSKKNIKLTK